MSVTVAIEEKSTISDESKLAICLALEVIAPNHGSDSCIE